MKKIINWLREGIINWKIEFIVIPLVFLFGIIGSVYIIEILDPTIGSYNPYNFYQRIIYALAALLGANLFTWLGMKFTFSPFYKHWCELKETFNYLPPQTKLWSSLFLYSFLLASLIYLMVNL